MSSQKDNTILARLDELSKRFTKFKQLLITNLTALTTRVTTLENGGGGSEPKMYKGMVKPILSTRSDGTKYSFVVGQSYAVSSLLEDDDFSNIGYNGVGKIWVATGTTPIHWEHNSVVVVLSESSFDTIIFVDTCDVTPIFSFTNITSQVLSFDIISSDFSIYEKTFIIMQYSDHANISYTYGGNDVISVQLLRPFSQHISFLIEIYP